MFLDLMKWVIGVNSRRYHSEGCREALKKDLHLIKLDTIHQCVKVRDWC